MQGDASIHWKHLWQQSEILVKNFKETKNESMLLRCYERMLFLFLDFIVDLLRRRCRKWAVPNEYEIAI